MNPRSTSGADRTAHRRDRHAGLGDADVRVGPLQAVPALLREFGADPDAVVARVGLRPADFADPDRRIPFVTAGALLAEAAAATKVPHFGLLVGSRAELDALGDLAQLVRNARSVRDALLDLVRHLHLQDRGAVPFLLDLGHGQVALGYAVYRHDTPGIGQVYDIAMAVGCNIMRALCGPNWKPVLVSLSRTAPRSASPYRRVFASPVRFDAAHSEIVFDAVWLDRPLAGADPARRRAFELLAQAQERDGRTAERVRRLVQGLVMTGEANAARVAAALGLHERALRRHLAAERTTLTSLVNAARFEVACQLLRGTQLPVSEIATALHYADATAFSRAFRSWGGASPRVWRAGAMPPAPGRPAARARPRRAQG